MKINSPDELWKYSLVVASLLYSKGFVNESKELESATKLPCTTGGEWLSELGAAVYEIKKRPNIPAEIKQHLKFILDITNSDNPYG